MRPPPLSQQLTHLVLLSLFGLITRGGIADVPGAARAPVRCSSLELSPNEMRC